MLFFIGVNPSYTHKSAFYFFCGIRVIRGIIFLHLLLFSVSLRFLSVVIRRIRVNQRSIHFYEYKVSIHNSSFRYCHSRENGNPLFQPPFIAPAIKYTKSTHFQEAPFLSFGHLSPKGGKIKCTVAQALAPYGGKWRFSDERGLFKRNNNK